MEVVDNDVVLKLARYRLLAGTALSPPGATGVLAPARFVVASRIRRDVAPERQPDVLAELEAFLAQAEALEPSEAELRLALSLEDEAARAGLALDVGECQLFAIATSRGVPRVCTGDKRAAEALEDLAGAGVLPPGHEHLIVCFEQVMLGLLRSLGLDDCRPRVCADRAADRAISACFACASSPSTEDVVTGLRSYIRDLGRRCPVILALDEDLGPQEDRVGLHDAGD